MIKQSPYMIDYDGVDDMRGTHFISVSFNQLFNYYHLYNCAPMNLTASLNKLLHSTTNAFRSIFDSSPSYEKVGKDNVNDVTMDSYCKDIEDSFVSNASQKGEAYNNQTYGSNLSFQGEQNNSDVYEKKSHLKVVYYNSQGVVLSNEIGKLLFENDQIESRKRVRQASIETFEEETNRLLKKYISNDGIPIERENNYTQINSIPIKIPQQHFTQTIFKIRIHPKYQIKDRGNQKNQYLPILRDFQINYETQKLQEMTFNQINCVSNLSVRNQWAMIQFLEPVNLLGRDFNKCLVLALNEIDIIDEEWKSKRVRISLYQNQIRSHQNISRVRRMAQRLGLKKMRVGLNGIISFTGANSS